MFANIFSFNGRIRRTEFGITYLACLFYSSIWDCLNWHYRLPVAVQVLEVVSFVPLLWILWAQGAKRCHDMGKRGWWLLLPLYQLWMVFASGTHGPNQYGEDPKKGTYERHPN